MFRGLGTEHMTEPSMVGKSHLILDSETPLVFKVKTEFLARSFLHSGNTHLRLSAVPTTPR